MILRLFRRATGRALFRAYELAVLDAVGDALSEEGRERLTGQVEQTAMVQRSLRDTSINNYERRSGKQAREEQFAFGNRDPDLKLATVRLRGPNRAGAAVVGASGGHWFGITFRPSPKDLGPSDSIEVTGVTLHADPMLPDDGRAVERRLEGLHRDLRRELEALWASGRAADRGLMGRDEVYRVDLEDGEHLMLAQLEDTSFVLAALGTSPPVVRRMQPDGELIGEYATVADALDAADGSRPT